jgi:hypothetical protein
LVKVRATLRLQSSPAAAGATGTTCKGSTVTAMAGASVHVHMQRMQMHMQHMRTCSTCSSSAHQHMRAHSVTQSGIPKPLLVLTGPAVPRHTCAGARTSDRRGGHPAGRHPVHCILLCRPGGCVTG